MVSRTGESISAQLKSAAHSEHRRNRWDADAAEYSRTPNQTSPGVSTFASHSQTNSGTSSPTRSYDTRNTSSATALLANYFRRIRSCITIETCVSFPGGVRLSPAPLKFQSQNRPLYHSCRLMPSRFSATAFMPTGYGGGVWESNPPFDPRRNESPALKAGKVTGPFSPPQTV